MFLTIHSLYGSTCNLGLILFHVETAPNCAVPSKEAHCAYERVWEEGGVVHWRGQRQVYVRELTRSWVGGWGACAHDEELMD
jgi:hypothetical protein